MAHNFEERVKYDYGFLIGRKYPVILYKNGMQVRHAVVYIPSRGRPRLSIKVHLHGNVYAINTNLIDKDELVYLGYSSAPAVVDEWNLMVADPEATIIEF